MVFVEFSLSFLGSITSWFLSFTPYLNLVFNILIVSIWSVTFLVLYQFSHYRYLLNRKGWCVNENNIKLFSILHQLQLYCHVKIFFFKVILKLRHNDHQNPYNLLLIFITSINPSNYNKKVFITQIRDQNQNSKHQSKRRSNATQHSL